MDLLSPVAATFTLQYFLASGKRQWRDSRAVSMQQHAAAWHEVQ